MASPNDENAKPIEICLGDILERELQENSHFSYEFIKSLETLGRVDESLCFEILKKELVKIDDLDKPVLITGRNISQSLLSFYKNDADKVHVTVIDVADLAVSAQNRQRKSLPNFSQQNGSAADHYQRPSKASTISGTLSVADNQELKEKAKRICELLNLKHPSSKVARPQASEVEPHSNFCINYFRKMKGGPPKTVHVNGFDSFFSFLTSFVGMLVLTSLDYFLLSKTATTLVIGSFAASAVLIFAATTSPLAQPKNLIFGHLVSGLVGVSVQMILGNDYPWLAGASAVALAIYVMCLTDTVHPPGGATALIAVYSDAKIHDLLFWYVLLPVGLGAVLLLLTALLTNNLFPTRSYPKWWN